MYLLSSLLCYIVAICQVSSYLSFREVAVFKSCGECRSGWWSAKTLISQYAVQVQHHCTEKCILSLHVYMYLQKEKQVPGVKITKDRLSPCFPVLSWCLKHLHGLYIISIFHLCDQLGVLCIFNSCSAFLLITWCGSSLLKNIGGSEVLCILIVSKKWKRKFRVVKKIMT